MSKEIIRYFIYALVLVALELICDQLKKKKRNPKEEKQTAANEITLPALLRDVGLLGAGTGIIIFLTFLMFFLHGNKTVTTGHLVVALIYIGINLLVALYGASWRIILHDNYLEKTVFFLFRKSVPYAQIASAKRDPKCLTLLDRNGRKLLRVDLLSNNIETLEELLEKEGKLHG